MLLLAALVTVSLAASADVPAGTVVPDVKCAGDPSQSYALYLPSAYTPDRAWPVIFGFDPGGRGRNPVDRYQAAAERYGFILAGSNNSRNGSAEVGQAVTAMSRDVAARFHTDPARIYIAGMSGGARVAVGVALFTPRVAGVVASSAGLPDGQPRKTLDFPIFMTAGTEDFNHLEMRRLDRALTTPHRLVIFNGGHTWLSPALAMEAVQWMELQAMKTGLEARDEGKIEAILAERLATVETETAASSKYVKLEAIVADFDGLKDVKPIAARVEVLGRDKAVRAFLNQERSDDDRELRLMMDVNDLEARLTVVSDRSDALFDLRGIWKDLAARAKASDDSLDRRLARRLLSSLSMTTTTDPDYLKIVREYRTRRP